MTSSITTDSIGPNEHVQDTNTNLHRCIGHLLKKCPFILQCTLFLVAISFWSASHLIYLNKYQCSANLYVFTTIPCYNACILVDDYSDVHLIYTGLFLECIAWHLGLSVQSFKWTFTKLLTIFVIIYPFLQNKIEVKQEEVCPESYYKLRIMPFCSDSYVIKQAIINPKLFKLLLIFFVGLFILVYIWNVYKFYRRRKLRKCLKSLPQRRQNINPELFLTQYSRNRDISVDNITEINETRMLNLILEKVTYIEKKFLEKANKKKRYTFINVTTSKPLIFTSQFHLAKSFYRNYLIVSTMVLIILLVIVVFFPDAEMINNFNITELFSPIRHDNKFICKQLLHLMSLIVLMFWARAIKYSPYHKTDLKPKDMLQYLLKVFWFVQEISRVHHELANEEYQPHDRQQLTGV